MRLAPVSLTIVLCVSSGWAKGQDLSLPESPMLQTATQAAAPAGPSQPPIAVMDVPEAPVPIAGDSIFAPLATGKGPESFKVKAEEYMVITIGPRALVSPAISAAIRMARPPAGYPRDWKDGGGAFGRNYASSYVGKVSLETARFGAGALLHEDFRYRPSKKTGFDRLFYAIGYTFVDSSDSGHRRIAVANFAGAAAGGFVLNSFLPDGYNTAGDGAKRFGSRMGGFAINNVTREYAPEIEKVVHALHIPFPRIPVREWWTSNLAISRSHP